MNNVRIENVKYIKTGGQGDLFLADDGEYRSMTQDWSDHFSYLIDVVDVSRRVYTTIGVVKVDWGDGEVSSATEHYYANTGLYTVKIFANDVKNCTTPKGANLIKVLELPNGLENMDSAFVSQTNLIECCALPNTVKSCKSTFSSCTSLTAMASFGDSGDVNCTRMYEDCTSLVDCEPINDDTTICDYMFSGCTSLLTPPALGDNVKNCSYMFEKCSNLTHTPVFTENIEDISHMFLECEGLVKVYPMKMISKVTDGKWMFRDCSSLTEVPILPEGLTKGDGMFDNCDSLIKTPILPDGFTNGYRMFGYCDKLITVTNLPEGLVNGVSMFENCKSLTTVPNLPSGLTDGSDMFYGCSSLTTVPDLPVGLVDGEKMFYGCYGLATAPILPEGLINGGYMFHGCNLTEAPNLPSTIEDYKYMFFANRIKSIPDDLMAFMNANPDLDGKERSCFGRNPIIYPQQYDDLRDQTKNPSYKWFAR